MRTHLVTTLPKVRAAWIIQRWYMDNLLSHCSLFSRQLEQTRLTNIHLFHALNKIQRKKKACISFFSGAVAMMVIS